MPELRKRKTPPPAPPKPAKRERKQPAEKPAANGNKATKAKESATAASAPVVVNPAEDTKDNKVTKDAKPNKSGPARVGDKIDFDSFGGEIETNDGELTTLKSLVEKSKAGVVLFTYPKASTPGCKSSPVSIYCLTGSDATRHNPSLSVQRLIRAAYCYWSRHLRSKQRLGQIQHDIQDEAEPALPAAVR